MMGKTCAACRSRKVKCDGAVPTCGPCSKARRSLQCEYATMPSQPKGPLLQKGSACYPCRRKKKKCDARRPFCTTCETAGKEDECQYEENVQRTVTEALVARNRELEQRLAQYEGRAETPSFSSVHSSPVPVPAQSLGINEFLSSVAATQPLFFGPFVQLASPLDMNPPVPALLPSPVDMELRPISGSPSHTAVMPPVHQLSEFRLTFLSHHGQLGVSFPDVKVKAIMTGDLSGATVHPVLIYVAQLMGCRLWQEQHQSTLSAVIEAQQLQFVDQALFEGPDPVTQLQVHSILAIYFLIKRRMVEGRDQLIKAAHVAVRYKLRFDAPPAERLQQIGDINDEAQEHICALSQLMYLDKAATLVLNDPSLLGPDFDQQFKTLPDNFPTISKNNLVVLRARSVGFLYHARVLSTRWTELILSIGVTHDISVNDIHAQWYDEYWDLLDDVTEQVSTLAPSMLKSSFYHQREISLALKMCMIISLTASAELHRLLMYHHPESRLKCIDVVFEIVSITRGLKDDDYIFLDPILGICWSMVATFLHSERYAPTEEASHVEWHSSFCVISNSAAKLGHTLPFMEQSMDTINGVASFEEVV